MTRPSRDSKAGQVYLDLQARARREHRPTDELFEMYILERFLYRLSVSTHRDRLVLKGGMLLAAFDERRPTRDVDLLARETNNEVGEISSLIKDVLAVEVDDDVTYDGDGLSASTIREQDPYMGVRIKVPARLHRAAQTLRIDLNVGDPVTPGPVDIAYPALLESPFAILGYPIETVLAEKIVTMVDRGDTTTRERDFADVYVLTGRHTVEALTLRSAIEATASHRESELRQLRDALSRLGPTRQADWGRFVERSGLGGSVPASYEDVIDAVASFADPILSGEIIDAHWNAAQRKWDHDSAGVT